MKKTLLKNALIFRHCGFEKTDILIEDGIIKQVATLIDDLEDAEVIDLVGLSILPGLVDMHVHLREPGFEHKETIASGTAAAARAGYSDVFSMPNLNPAPDTTEHVNVQLRAIRSDAKVRVHPYGCITMGQRGEGDLVDFEALAPYVAGYSDDGRGVQSEELMREAMKKCKALNKMIVAHCEVNSLLNGGYIHDGEYARKHHHKGISSESEWKQVERDIQLVRETGCRYHVCHVSTKESVALIREAKKEGLPITCETAPHYLLLTDMDLEEAGSYKMNPPLRAEEDRLALIEGIKDGTIDCIVTDHAPHAAEEKNKGLVDSAFGITGLETAFPIMYSHMVKKRIITMEKLIELMSTNPRKIMGLPPVTTGQPADLTVMNFGADYKINPNHFVSSGKSTPFAGWKVNAECVMTMIKGEIVYSLYDNGRFMR